MNFEDLKDRAEIVSIATQVIGEATGMAGEQVTFNCPQHESQSGKSFHVHPGKQLFFCRACNVGGDVITMMEFIRFGKVGKDLDKESRWEALAELAQLSGVELESISEEEHQRREEADKVFTMLTQLSDYWHEELLKRQDVIDWIGEQWGFDLEQIKEAKIGYARENVGLKRLNPHSLSVGAYIGLPEKKRMLPFFQGRVVFPYMVRGQCRYAIGRKTPWTPDNKYEDGKYKKLLTHSPKHPYVSPHIRNDLLFNETSIITAKRVIITEGIADCITLMLRGIPSISPVTTSPKNSTFKPISRKLANKEVVIINDSDEGGRKGAERTAKNLERLGITAKIGKLIPKIPGEKIDVCDFFKKGGSVADLERIIRESQTLLDIKIDVMPMPSEEGHEESFNEITELLKDQTSMSKEMYLKKIRDRLDVSMSAVRDTFDVMGDTCKLEEDQDARKAYNYIGDTEFSNAERFVELCGDKLKYIKSIGWFVWDGRRWLEDDAKVFELYTKTVIPAIYKEAAEAIEADDRKTAEKIIKWGKRSESNSNIKNSINLASTMPEVYLKNANEMNRNPWKFNCMNGTINLKTGVLYPHNQEDLISQLSPVNYNPAAESPRWNTFLTEILSNDEDMIDFIQKAIGYSITGSVSEQICFFCHGQGSNGKGELLYALLSVMGDYGVQTAPDLLLQSKNGAPKHPTEQADLYGRRFAVAQESEQGRRLAENTLKQIVSSDRIKARRMFRDFFEFDPTHKLWFACNHRPVIIDNTHSIWRRIRLIPFEVIIPPERQDIYLREKLEAEYEGILNFIVQGCIKYQREGLKPPEASIKAAEDYRDTSDGIIQFIEAKCIVDKNNESLKASISEVYSEYREWCEDEGERCMSKRAFGESLLSYGFKRGRGTSGVRTYQGITLKTSEPADRYINKAFEETSHKHEQQRRMPW